MKWLKVFLILFILFLSLTIVINEVIIHNSKLFIYRNIEDVPACYSAIVLGALVYQSGSPSDFLRDRLDVAIDLYKNGKIKRLLLSGDHGRINYDEVNNMKSYLLENGIDTKDIFLDHAGFDTYNTMVRAREIFGISDVIIVSQQFHLPRAVYLARSKGLTAYGIIADRRQYKAIKRLKFREILANVKAITEVIIHKNPKFLGNQIPITGDSRLSYD